MSARLACATGALLLAAASPALAKSLNQAADQQGSEGLESFRAALVLGHATRF